MVLGRYLMVEYLDPSGSLIVPFALGRLPLPRLYIPT